MTSFKEDVAHAIETLATKHNVLKVGQRLVVSIEILPIELITIELPEDMSGENLSSNREFSYLPSLRVWANEVIQFEREAMNTHFGSFLYQQFRELEGGEDGVNLEKDDFPVGSLRWLVRLEEDSLVEMAYGIGTRTVQEIKEILASHGLALGMDENLIQTYEEIAVKSISSEE